MKHTSFTILAILGVTLLLPACKKNNGGGGGGNSSDVYYPATLSYYEGSNSAYPQKSTFKYDDKHHLTWFGNTDRFTSISGNAVGLQVNSGRDTTVLANLFGGNIITGEVGEVRSNYLYKSNGTSTTSAVSTYYFTGMSKTTNATPSYNGGTYTQFLTLDGNGNVTFTKYVTNAVGSPNSNSYDPGGQEYDRLTFTGYDTKSSPYSAIPEYKFAAYPWSYPEQMYFAFSKHNPTQIIEESLNTTTMKWSTYRQVDFTYTYNDQGYPTEVRIKTYYPSSQGPSGQNTYYATYDFTYAK